MIGATPATSASLVVPTLFNPTGPAQGPMFPCPNGILVADPSLCPGYVAPGSVPAWLPWLLIVGGVATIGTLLLLRARKEA